LISELISALGNVRMKVIGGNKKRRKCKIVRNVGGPHFDIQSDGGF